MTKPPIPNGVAVVPLARRAKWARKLTQYDTPEDAIASDFEQVGRDLETALGVERRRR